MSNPLNVTYVDLVGPPISASWLNAVSAAALAVEGTTPTNITSTSGQTVFTVPAASVGIVYINGIYQIPGVNFSRTNSTTITFSAGVPSNAIVTVL